VSPLRPIYDWAVRQAGKPYVGWILYLLAVIEPCIFPTPPDILLVPACIANREKSYKFAGICLAGSMTGGLIGYGIGALAMAKIGDWIIDTYKLQDAYEHFHHGFHHWGLLIIAAKASVPFIPVPFFLVTIMSGAAHFSLVEFLLVLFGVRTTRFFLEAFLLRKFGAPIQAFIERYLTWVAVAIVVILAIWVVCFAHEAA
jgi:membrane protein YqaA with SNARE-associated domain